MQLDELTHLNSVALPLSVALDEFFLHQRTSRNSPKTLKYYEYSLGRFGKWLDREGVSDMLRLEARDLRRFLCHLQDDGLRPASVHLIMRAVRAFFNFLEREELIARTPMRKVQMPSQDKTILPAFEPNEVAAMIRATEGKDVRSLRNRALVLVLLDSGLRLAECASLQVGSIDRETGALRVMGKGRKERLARVGVKARTALMRYLRARGCGDGAASEPLWVGTKGALTTGGIAEALDDVGRVCGVHVHPHKFRRTCALMLLRNGADVFSVQQILGHADLTVLRRYLAQSQADIQGVHARCSPADLL